MADFCNNCDAMLGGMRGIAPKGQYAWVVCECCGPTYVNRAGNCVRVGCACTHGQCINGGPYSHKARPETITLWWAWRPVRCVDAGWTWGQWVYRFRQEKTVFYRRAFRVWG